MERNSEKRRRPKYATGQPISPIVKYRDNAAENLRTADNCWKYHQGNEVNSSNDRNERTQSNSAIEHSKIHYCPDDVPRTSRNKHGLSSLSRIKYVVPKLHEEFHGFDKKNQGTLRLSRDQLLRQYVGNASCANNIAVVRKNRYIDNFDEAEELENSTFNENDNAANETSEEVVDEERREDTIEFNEKDYDEHEADDEIDEESDVLERQIDRTRAQRKIRMEPLPRAQKISAPFVPSRYHRGVKIGIGKTSERCCHSAAERKISSEIPSEDEAEQEEEEPESASYSPKKLICRSRQGEEVVWKPGKNSTERYSVLPERSLLPDSRKTRRPRTTRPEMERTTRSSVQYDSIRNTKCDRCGRTSGQTPKTTSSRNATCRLQDSRYFIGEPIGDELFEDPTIPTTYQTKPRRSKETRSPIYESNETGQTIDDEDEDEIGAIYKTYRGKNYREKTSLRRSSVRANDRHEEKLNSKSNKRY